MAGRACLFNAGSIGFERHAQQQLGTIVRQYCRGFASIHMERERHHQLPAARGAHKHLQHNALLVNAQLGSRMPLEKCTFIASTHV